MMTDSEAEADGRELYDELLHKARLTVADLLADSPHLTADATAA